MVDAIKSNLEPIEEGDLDLERKFAGKPEAAKAQKKSEKIPLQEALPERKEGAVEKDSAYSKILSKIKTQGPAADEGSVAKDAGNANLGIDAESKIQNLVDLAMQKGVAHAVKVARHLEDNYALDEFHDRLVADELHVALVKKGLLEEL